MATNLRTEELPIRGESDLVRVRQAVRSFAGDEKFGTVEATKIVTAASELARNVLTHGGGGMAIVQLVTANDKRGIRIEFVDRGPGIPDIDQALRDGYTTNNGMGLGLGGARRLVNEFEIQSKVGEGTRVTITRWKQR